MRAATDPIALLESLAARLTALARRPLAWFGLGALWAVLLLVLYAPALGGAFVSDDYGFIVNNPWVREPTRAHVLALLHPYSEATAFAANWAPVHLLSHALQWQLFGEHVHGYHVMNVLLHALVSVQLVSLYARSGLGPLPALLGGAFFLVHPANVEVVAWISEVKTLLAMTLALGALQLQMRRPGLAVALFALALLAKALAVFALPVAILRVWCGPRSRTDAAGAPRAGWWLLAWGVVLALYAPPQWAAFQRIGQSDLPLHEDPFVTARTVVAFAARYLVMAATGTGLSAFHDPPRALSPLDPWWLLGLAGLVVCGVRSALCFARRREEAVYWAWAFGGWLPIAQIFPFTYTMGDRYLYFPLPGLIGVALLWARAALQPSGAPGNGEVARWPRVALAAGVALWLVLLGARVPARASLWRSEPLLVADAARHYPDGIQGNLQRAFRAAEQGDAAGAAAALARARAKGFDQFMAIDRIPAFAPIRRDPALREAKAELAGLWLARFEPRRPVAHPSELRVAALAHAARGEREQAIALLERALAMPPGPWHPAIEAELAALRRGARR